MNKYKLSIIIMDTNWTFCLPLLVETSNGDPISSMLACMTAQVKTVWRSSYSCFDKVRMLITDVELF